MLEIALGVVAPPKDSSRPFPEALRELMHLREASFRPIARATDYSTGYVNALATGRQRPTPENMERLARALDVHPRYFREYRVHMARERAAALADRIGLDKVMDALNDADH